MLARMSIERSDAGADVALARYSLVCYTVCTARRMRVKPSQASATARARAVSPAGAFKSLESLLMASDALSDP